MLGALFAGVIFALAASVAFCFAGIGWKAFKAPLQKGVVVPSKSNPASSTTLEIVSGRLFRNQEVVLDGKEHVNCKFENVTFILNGGPWKLNHNTIGGMTVKSNNIEVNRVMQFFHDFGLMKIGGINDYGPVKPGNPVPDAILRNDP